MKQLIKFLLRENLLDEEVVGGQYYHGSSYPKLEWGLAPEDYNRGLFGYGIYLTTNKQEAISYALDSSEKGYLFSLKLNGLNVVDFNNEPVSENIKIKLEKTPNFYSLFYVKFDPNLFNFEDMYYNLGDNIYYDWDYYDTKSAKYNNKPEGYFLAKWVDNKIVDEFYGLKPEDVITTISKLNDVGEFSNLYYEDENIEIKKNELFEEYDNLYFYLTKLLKSSKEASKLFSNMGIDGFKAKGVGVDKVAFEESDYIVNIINPNKLNDIKSKIVTSKDVEQY
jgi:hypothetical protein